LFVGNLSYSTTEADLRTYFGAVAPPSQVVLPVDRETGRPRGFAFVEFIERPHAEQAIQRFNGQIFNGRPLAVSEARAREDRGPGGPGPRPGGAFGGPRPIPGSGFSGPRPGGFSGPPRPGGSGFGGPPRPFDPSAPQPPRNRNFGPDAKPQRGQNAKAKKKEAERPRGPIPTKFTGRSFSLDDDSPDESLPDIDDFATSKPSDKPAQDPAEDPTEDPGGDDE
jgi:RNA recognition motif-containing protein